MAKPPCVLVVDDSVDMLQTMSDILGVAGYAVRTAPSAERALQILEGAAVDLVITDLRMSGMGGMAFLQRLRESRPDLPVIALSGFADAATVTQAFREGAVDFIAKPFTAEEVLQAVARALAQRGTSRTSDAATASPRGSSLAPAQRAQADEVLRALQGRLGAELALLAGPGGELLAAQGFAMGPAAETVARGIGQIGALLEPLAAALGEPAFAVHAWEGERRALYAIRLPDQRFVVVVVPRTVKPGLVWLELREAASRLSIDEARPPEVFPPSPVSLPSETPSTPEVESPFTGWEEIPPPLEGELLSYDEARARGLIPDFDAGAEEAE